MSCLLRRRLFSTFNMKGTLSRTHCPVGAYAEVQHSFSQESVCTFSEICGDNNPLHNEPEIAKKSMFKGTIVHGILVSSLFSGLLGRSIHGAVYVNQTLQFRRPVHVGAPILARVEVVKTEVKSKGIFLTCSTTCVLPEQHNVLAVSGEATCLVPHELNE